MEKSDYTLLGHLIVKQFGLEDENVDLISKWMANYIAQKIKTASMQYLHYGIAGKHGVVREIHMKIWNR